MNTEIKVAKVYLMVDCELHGPFTVQEAHGMITSGTLVSEPPAAKSASPMSARVVDIGAPAGPASSASPNKFGEPLPLGSVLVDLVLVVLLITGVILAMYYGLFFETAPGGTQNAGRLADRLCGVIGGTGLAVVVLLVKILRKLPERR